ncbi:zinc finger BED domain-containing protein 4-like [Rhinophrynus dorsalis]
MSPQRLETGNYWNQAEDQLGRAPLSRLRILPGASEVTVEAGRDCDVRRRLRSGVTKSPASLRLLTSHELLSGGGSRGVNSSIRYKTCSVLTPADSMSAVWNYFKICEDNPRMAACKVCSARISRGGTKVSAYNTSNLIKHLRLKHQSEHAEFVKGTSGSSQQQLTLQQTLARREKMSKENPRAIKITEALVHFIVLDDQPLSVVENKGFQRLVNVLEPKYDMPSRRYVTDVVLPQVHDQVKKHISSILHDGIKAISFTTDIWSSSVSPVSLISLTAQWIDDNFELQQVMLHAKKFQGSHTGEAIAGMLEGMLETWGIQKSSVHVVVRDSARNMIRGMEDAGVQSISCVAHTLQLAVSEGLLSQRSIADAVGVGRRIVGHFKHSNLAYSRLQDIQLELGQTVKRLQQDVPTRWNSTFYMLQSFLEQKRALGLYASEYELPATLTPNQWSLMEKTLNILSPFEELTRQVSASDALASDVIPAVTVLLRMLSREVDEDHGVKTMKSTLLAAVRKRFSDTEENPLYCLATLLDPRYKDRFFNKPDTARQVRELFPLELQKMSVTPEEHEEPALKRPHSEQPGTSLDSLFEEIAGEGSSSESSAAPTAASIQLETYLGEITVSRSDKPLKYWAVNKLRFPALAQMAQKYLSAPCSSVESERLFSSVSNVLSESRNRLLAEHAEVLLFLKKNLPLTFEK